MARAGATGRCAGRSRCALPSCANVPSRTRPFTKSPRSRFVSSVSATSAAADPAAWAVLAACGALGVHAEKTRVGAALTGPVCAMLAACSLTQVGLLPDGMVSSLPGMQLMLAKLATPLLLQADLRQALKGAHELLPAFILAAATTVAAALVATATLHGPLKALGAPNLSPDAGLHLAAALTAKNIGGSINYLGVATAMEVPQPLITAGIAADNLAALLYFPAVSALASQPWCMAVPVGQGQHAAPLEKASSAPEGSADSRQRPVGNVQADCKQVQVQPAHDQVGQASQGELLQHASSHPVGSQSLMLSLTLALGVVCMCERFGTAALPASTVVMVALATAWPSLMRSLAASGTMLATCLLYMYFASAGAASGSLQTLLSSEHACIASFLAILYIVHLLLLLGVGSRVLRMRGPELLVASHANIGSAATVACLVQAKGWLPLLLPGMLAANLGNAVATFVGLALARLLSA